MALLISFTLRVPTAQIATLNTITTPATMPMAGTSDWLMPANAAGQSAVVKGARRSRVRSLLKKGPSSSAKQQRKRQQEQHDGGQTPHQNAAEETFAPRLGHRQLHAAFLSRSFRGALEQAAEKSHDNKDRHDSKQNPYEILTAAYSDLEPVEADCSCQLCDKVLD